MHDFAFLWAGMRVKWKPTNQTGTILGFSVDVEAPKRFGIQAEVRWDDGKTINYGAEDFANDGDMEIVVEP
jgi:outer membrane lipoprotein SlyB